jgi:hypothetical protein
MQHADYPHEPGMLYDCEVCASTCFCDPMMGECIHCALVQESEAMAAEYDRAAWYVQDA